MKNIIIQQGSGANLHIRNALVNAYRAAGFNCYFWDESGKSAFDVFAEFPHCELFIGSVWQLTRALVKCLANRPNIKVILYSDIFGSIEKELNFKEYPVGRTTEDQKYLVETLIKSGCNLIGLITNHGQRDVLYTHNGWTETFGLPVHSVLTSADITTFFPRNKDERYQTQLFFCGGYWGYKSINLDKYIKPLTYPTTKWKIRVAGNGWNGVNSVGIISDEETARHYTNSQVVPHIVEPHASDVYSDIPLRYTQTAACGGFAVSCPCVGIRDIFIEDELVVADNPQDFFDKIVQFLNNPQDALQYRQKAFNKVIAQHTGFDRCIQLMNILEEDFSSLQDCKAVYTERAINESRKHLSF